MSSVEQKPKVLFVDIETTPIKGWVWNLWDTNVIKVIDDWHMLCFSYKWMGEKAVKNVSQIDFPSAFKKDKKDDYNVVLKLRELFDEADVIIGHNGDAFDIRKANTRMIVNGIKPPSPYLTIDTKKIAKKYFGFSSNSLNALAIALGLEPKADAGGFTTWEGCMAGDRKKWAHMVYYNNQDVVCLEDVYMALRPWMRVHPALRGISGFQCPVCGSSRTQKRGVERTVSGKEYQRYQCQAVGCGRWSKQMRSNNGNSELR